MLYIHTHTPVASPFINRNISMKQKIVIRVRINCDKCRSTAMKFGAAAEGVDQVGMEGEDKDQLVLIGDGIDLTSLATTLRKKLGHADIIKVEEVKKEEKKEKKKEEKKEEEEKPPAPPYCQNSYLPNCPYHIVFFDDSASSSYSSSHANNCTVM